MNAWNQKLITSNPPNDDWSSLSYDWTLSFGSRLQESGQPFH